MVWLLILLLTSLICVSVLCKTVCVCLIYIFLCLSVRAFRPAPTSSSLSYQSGEQWTRPFYSRVHSSNRLQHLTDLHALSKKCLCLQLYAFPVVPFCFIFFLWVYVSTVNVFVSVLDCMFQSLPLLSLSLWLTVRQGREKTMETVHWFSGLAPPLCSMAR